MIIKTVIYKDDEGVTCKKEFRIKGSWVKSSGFRLDKDDEVESIRFAKGVYCLGIELKPEGVAK